MIKSHTFFFFIFWPRLKNVLTLYRKLFLNKIPCISGKNVLIVGTSPQLDFQLLSKGDYDFSMGLHRIHKIFDLTFWRPNLLFLGDEALIIKHGKEIVDAQDPETLIVTGSTFWNPSSINNNKTIFIKLREKADGDFRKAEYSDLINDAIYILGDSVLIIALQYCIKQRVKKITITGVNFNYESGYIHKDINNEGINQPSPQNAFSQYIYLRKVCDYIGIIVEHDFELVKNY